MYRSLFFTICLTGIAIAFISSAQTAPEFIVSWKAVNYVPSDFQGKIFPTKGSSIIVGFDLLDRNQFANLSRAEIQWNVDGAVVQTGIGTQQIQFQSNNNDNQHIVRIAVRNYGATELNYTSTIPIKKPFVVIDAPVPNRRLGLGSTLFQILPYFFNTNNMQNLQFHWFRDGKIITGNTSTPYALTLEISSEGNPVDSNISLSASVQNLLNPIEAANQLLNLKIR